MFGFKVLMKFILQTLIVKGNSPFKLIEAKIVTQLNLKSDWTGNKQDVSILVFYHIFAPSN